MYVVVLWGDYTQAVPIHWVDETNKILKWPPKDMKPGLAIKKQLHPGKNWETIHYTKIVHRCESFSEAKKMEVEASYLSTDGSFCEAKNESGKRKIKKPDMDAFQTTFLPVDTYVPEQDMESQIFEVASPTIGNVESQEDSSGDDQCGDDDNETAAKTYEIDSQESYVPEPSKNKKPKHSFEDTIPCPCHEGMKKVFQELSRFRRELEEFTRRSSVSGTAAQSSNYSLLPRFPLTTAKHVQQFEEALTNEAMQLQFKSKVMGVGGRDLPGNLRNILKLIMTNNVATQFTWTGAKSPNMAIRGTKFISIIFEVLHIAYPQSTTDTMENITREWFRHASDRLKKLNT